MLLTTASAAVLAVAASMVVAKSNTVPELPASLTTGSAALATSRLFDESCTFVFGGGNVQGVGEWLADAVAADRLRGELGVEVTFAGMIASSDFSTARFAAGIAALGLPNTVDTALCGVAATTLAVVQVGQQVYRTAQNGGFVLHFDPPVSSVIVELLELEEDEDENFSFSMFTSDSRHLADVVVDELNVSDGERFAITAPEGTTMGMLTMRHSDSDACLASVTVNHACLGNSQNADDSSDDEDDDEVRRRKRDVRAAAATDITVSILPGELPQAVGGDELCVTDFTRFNLGPATTELNQKLMGDNEFGNGLEAIAFVGDNFEADEDGVALDKGNGNAYCAVTQNVGTVVALRQSSGDDHIGRIAGDDRYVLKFTKPVSVVLLTIAENDDPDELVFETELSGSGTIATTNTVTDGLDDPGNGLTTYVVTATNAGEVFDEIAFGIFDDGGEDLCLSAVAVPCRQIK